MRSDHLIPIEILVVEPGPQNVEDIRLAFVRAGLEGRVHGVTSEAQALNFLHQQGPYTNAPIPDMILLDPAVSERRGWCVFAEIKAHPQLKRIPVVIQTEIEAEAQLLKEHQINDLFIVRPLDYRSLSSIIRSIPKLAGARHRPGSPDNETGGEIK